PHLRPMPPIPSGSKPIRISTDNGGVLILYENGEVWAAGSNNRSQLGIARLDLGQLYLTSYNPVLRKVTLPGPAIDIYATDYDPDGLSSGTGLSSYNNSFFI